MVTAPVTTPIGPRMESTSVWPYSGVTPAATHRSTYVSPIAKIIDICPNQKQNTKTAKAAISRARVRLPGAPTTTSAATPPTTIPTGPLQNMPIRKATAPAMTPISEKAPRLGTRWARYMNTLPANKAPAAWANHVMPAFMPKGISTAMNTMNSKTPNTAMKTRSLGFRRPRSCAAEPIVSLFFIANLSLRYCVCANPMLRFSFGSVFPFKANRSTMRPPASSTISSHAEHKNS